MRKDILFGLLIAGSVIMAVGCTHKETPAPANPGTGTGNNNPNTNPNPVDTGICFERDILPIFISNCAKSGCHDAASRQDGFQFTDYNSITGKEFVHGNAGATEIYEKITENDNDKRMPPPPSPRLTSQQTDMIRRWINEGAKNTTNCGTLCDTNSFNYSTAIKPLTDQYCKGCHNSAAPSGGLALDNYSGARTVALNGKLLAVIKHQPGFPQMPKGGAKLSDCQVRQVEKWIANGALDN